MADQIKFDDWTLHWRDQHIVGASTNGIQDVETLGAGSSNRGILDLATSYGRMFPTQVSAENPSSWYRFHELSGTSLVDQMNVRNGVYVGTPVFSSLSMLAQPGNRLVQFSGDDHGDISPGYDFTNGSYSIFARIRTSSFAAPRVILGGDAGSPGLKIGTDGRLYAFVVGGADLPVLFFNDMDAGLPTFVCVSYNAAVGRIGCLATWWGMKADAQWNVINGWGVGGNPSLTPGAMTRYIGRQSSTVGNNYVGDLDELVLWDGRALSWIDFYTLIRAANKAADDQSIHLPFPGKKGLIYTTQPAYNAAFHAGGHGTEFLHDNDTVPVNGIEWIGREFYLPTDDGWTDFLTGNEGNDVCIYQIDFKGLQAASIFLSLRDEKWEGVGQISLTVDVTGGLTTPGVIVEHQARLNAALGSGWDTLRAFTDHGGTRWPMGIGPFCFLPDQFGNRNRPLNRGVIQQVMVGLKWSTDVADGWVEHWHRQLGGPGILGQWVKTFQVSGMKTSQYQPSSGWTAADKGNGLSKYGVYGRINKSILLIHTPPVVRSTTFAEAESFLSSAEAPSNQDPYAQAVFSTPGLFYYTRVSDTDAILRPAHSSINGSYVGGYTQGIASAVIGGDSAVALNGTSGYLAIPHDPIFNVGPVMTIEFWFKRNSIGGTPTITSKGTGGPIVWFRDDNKLGLWREGGLEMAHSSKSHVDMTGWHHAMISIDSSLVRIMVDGEEDTISDNAQTIVNTLRPMWIGAEQVSGDTIPGFFFNGWLDEIAFYSVALGITHARAHYELGSGRIVGGKQLAFRQFPRYLTREASQAGMVGR